MKHRDISRFGVGFDPPAAPEAVYVGQVHVEDDEVRSFPGQPETLTSADRLINVEPFTSQDTSDGIACSRVVIYVQDHCLLRMAQEVGHKLRHSSAIFPVDLWPSRPVPWPPASLGRERQLAVGSLAPYAALPVRWWLR